MDRAPSMEGQGNWKGDPGKMQHKRYKKLKKKKSFSGGHYGDREPSTDGEGQEGMGTLCRCRRSRDTWDPNRGQNRGRKNTPWRGQNKKYRTPFPKEQGSWTGDTGVGRAKKKKHTKTLWQGQARETADPP